MNDEAPVGKAYKGSGGKYYHKNLPAKQLTMYNLTNEARNWGKSEILNHYYDVLDLLNRQNEILKIS